MPVSMRLRVPLALEKHGCYSQCLDSSNEQSLAIEPIGHWAVLSPIWIKHAGARSACQARFYWPQAK